MGDEKEGITMALLIAREDWAGEHEQAATTRRMDEDSQNAPHQSSSSRRSAGTGVERESKVHPTTKEFNQAIDKKQHKGGTLPFTSALALWRLRKGVTRGT